MKSLTVHPSLIQKNDIRIYLMRFHDRPSNTYANVLKNKNIRTNEVVSLTFDNINFEKRMIISNKSSRTKKTWVTFFNEEASELLSRYLQSRTDKDPRIFPILRRQVAKLFKLASKSSRVKITAQTLRDWFCEEMGKLGVSDRYIDVFCGRVPKSVLANHYTDYSPEKLKAIYDKAGLRVLS